MEAADAPSGLFRDGSHIRALARAELHHHGTARVQMPMRTRKDRPIGRKPVGAVGERDLRLKAQLFGQRGEVGLRNVGRV